MNNIDKRNLKNWTKEERDRVVGLFEMLIEMDKKQNPDLYNHKKDRIVINKDEEEVIL